MNEEMCHVAMMEIYMSGIEDQDYVVNPGHGGKATCHKCNGFILRKDIHFYEDNFHFHNDFEYFHKDCFNPYEHYYGLDRPLD